MDPRYPAYHSMTNGVDEEAEEEEDDDEPEEGDAGSVAARAWNSAASSSGEEEEEVEEEYLDEGRPDDAADLARRAAALPAALQPVYRVLQILMSPENHVHNWPFMNAVDSKSGTLWDYDAVVKAPVWLKKVREKLLQQEYDTPTAVFAELRLMLRNCYRYNGPQHSVTRRALRLEQIMEQLVEQLEPELRHRCTLEATDGPEAVVDPKIVNRRRSVRNKTPGFFSHVLHWVRHERADREKEFRRQKLEAKRQQRQEKENSIVAWEARLVQGETGERLRAMWELPQLAQFVHLSLRALNIFEVPLYEMERMLLVPQSSETLAMMMTSLVSAPLIRTKLGELPPMPYTMWTEKLAARVALWYRAYAKEAGRTDRLLDTQGIEPAFWQVVGTRNPFGTRLFHQLSFYQRVWMVKTMCDFLFHNHKTVQECVMEASLTEPRENLLGRDRHGYEYVHLPHLFVQDVRLYRRRAWRAPDEWQRAAPEPPPAAPAPLRAAELGGRWSRARLEKFRRRLSQLRRGSERTPRRPAGVRRTFTCLGGGGAATPAGSPSDTEDEAESASEGSSVDEAPDEGPEFTLTRSGRRSQRPPRRPGRSSPGGGAGAALGRRKGAAAAAAAAAATATATVESPTKRGRGRGRGKGRGGSRTSTPAKQQTPQATDQNVCPHCGMSIRSERARKAHRCFQEQASSARALAADSASASEASDSSHAPESEPPRTPRAGRGRGRRSGSRPTPEPSPAPAATPGRGGRRGPGRPRGRGRPRTRPPVLQPEESRASTADQESMSGTEELSRLSAPELESAVSAGEELSRLSAPDGESGVSGAEELSPLSPPRLAPVSPGRRSGPSDAEERSGDEDLFRMEVDEDTRAGDEEDGTTDGLGKGEASPPGAEDNAVSSDGEGAAPPREGGSKASTPGTESVPAQHEGGAPAPARAQEPSDTQADGESPGARPAQDSAPIGKRGAAGDGAAAGKISAPGSGREARREGGDSGRSGPAAGGGGTGADGEKPDSGQAAGAGSGGRPTTPPGGVANGRTVNGEVRGTAENGLTAADGDPGAGGDVRLRETPADVARVKQETGKSAADGRPSDPTQARVKLEPSEEAMDSMDVKLASADGKGNVERRLGGGKLKDFQGMVDGVKCEPGELKPVLGDKKPGTATADAKPGTLKSDPDQKRTPAHPASVKPQPSRKPRPAGVKPEPRASTRADSGDSSESEGDGAAGPELPVPEPVAEPTDLPPPDPDEFQLVASTFDGLRRLVDAFDPEAETAGKKKGQKQPACEVELHKALKKILEELEPLETKINQSVRRMRKRLCQEWLNYIERPADYVDPNEEAWVEPDQEPEPASKASEKSPTPSPEPSDEEELMDAEGRRKQRSRRAKRKRVNYCVDGGAGAAAADGREPDAWQMSSRGRMRKVRKMDDFAYESEENSQDRAQRDGDLAPGEAPASASASPARAARAARPAAGAVGSSADQSLPRDWEAYRQRMLQREQARRTKLPPPPPPRPPRITEPSPAWNSELSILNENMGDRVSRIRSQIQQKIARRPTIYRPRPEAPGPRRAAAPAVTTAAGPRPPLGQRMLVNRANLVGGALTKVVHMSGANSPFVLRMGRDGRVFMDKVPASTAASAATSLPAAAPADGAAAAAPSRAGDGVTSIDSAEGFGDIKHSPVTPGLTASPAKTGLAASPVKVVAASAAGSAGAAGGVGATVTAARGPPPGSKVAVVLPYKDPVTGNTMYMQLPPEQANSILQSLNLPGLAASSGATSVSTFTAAVTVASAALPPGAAATSAVGALRFTSGPAVRSTGGVAVSMASVPSPASATFTGGATVPVASAPAPAPTRAPGPAPARAPGPAPLRAPAPTLVPAPTLASAQTLASAPTLAPAQNLASAPATVAAAVHLPHRSVLVQHVQSLPIAPGGSRQALQQAPPPAGLPRAAGPAGPAALSSDIAARVKAALQQVQARGAPLDKQQAQRLAARVVGEQRVRPPPPPYAPAASAPILQQQLAGGSPRKQQAIRPMPPVVQAPPVTVGRPARPALVAAGQTRLLGPGQTLLAGQPLLASPQRTLVAGQPLLASPQRTLVAGQPAVLATSPPTLLARTQPTLIASSQQALLTSSPPTLLTGTQQGPLLTVNSQPALFTTSQPALLTSAHATVLTSSQPAFFTSSQTTLLSSSPPTLLAGTHPTLLTTSRATLLTGSQAALLSSPALLTSQAPLIGSPPALLTAGPSLAVRPPPSLSRVLQPALGPPPMQRAPRYVSTSVQFMAAGGAPAPGPRPPAAQQGKVVIIKSGAEQKLGVLMPNGQIVELSEKQANNVKLEALRRSRPDAPS